MSHFKQRLLLFKNPAFSLFFFSCFTATLGAGMGYIAMTWLVIKAQNSVGAVAILMLCFWLPGIILGPIMGAVVDRFPRRHHLIALSSWIRGLTFIAFGYGLWHYQSLDGLYVLSCIQGAVFSIYIPAAWRLIREIVPEKQLLPANATVDMAYEVGCVLGMGSVGLLIHLVGAPFALILNGILFVISASALLGIRPKHLKITESGEFKLQFIQDFKDAIAYLRPKRQLIQLYAVQLIFYIEYMTAPVLLAPFAKSTLHVNASEFGYLEASLSMGAVIGGFIMPILADKVGIKQLVFWVGLLLAVCYFSFAHNHFLVLADILYFGIGIAFSIWAVVVTASQHQTDVRFQGRLQSCFSSISGLVILSFYLGVRFTSGLIPIQSLYWALAFLAIIAAVIARPRKSTVLSNPNEATLAASIEKGKT